MVKNAIPRAAVLLLAVLAQVAVRGDIIVVDTRGGPPPQRVYAIPPQAPTGAAVLEGLPRDFRFFAIKAYPDPDPDRSVELARQDIASNEAKLDKGKPRLEGIPYSPGIVGSFLVQRPALYVWPDRLDPQERIPQKWRQTVHNRTTVLNAEIAAACRIEIHGMKDFPIEMIINGKLPEPTGWETGILVGTGFVVGPNLVMTNRHVVEFFARYDPAKKEWVFVEDTKSQVPAEVWVEFAGVSRKPSRSFVVERVLYATPPGPERDSELDVALLEIHLEDGAALPSALALQRDEPVAKDLSATRDLAVCGYLSATRDKRVESHYQQLKVKRLSLGELVKIQPTLGAQRLHHSCVTAGGNSGSPVVDLVTGTVWGLHFADYTDPNSNQPSNLAEPMWRILQVPEIRSRVSLVDPPPFDDELKVPQTFVVEDQTSRPVLFVKYDLGSKLDGSNASIPFPNEAGAWISFWGKAHINVRKAAAAVGLLSVVRAPDSTWPRGPLCTVFVVAPRVVAVPSALIMDWLGPDQAALRYNMKMSVGFGTDKPGQPIWSCDVIRPIHFDPDSGFALLLLAEPLFPFPEFTWVPLEIEDESAREPRQLKGHAVAVIGHPVENPRVPPEVFNRVFPPPYGVQRLALGSIVRLQPDKLVHDCSTSLADLGAPIVSLETGRVVGVHLGGEYLKENYGLPIWKLLDNPKLEGLAEVRSVIQEYRERQRKAPPR